MTDPVLRLVGRMTADKARRELELLLPEVEAEEAEMEYMQGLLGESCRDLRVANYLSRKLVAERLGATEAQVRCIERRATSEEARRYARVCWPVEGARST